MITAYHMIASGNIDIPIDITQDFSTGINMPEMEQTAKFKYFNAHSNGLKWYSGKHEYIIYEEGRHIHGIMTPDFKKVVVIYPYDHPVFNSPGNAVIYNEDKSIYMIPPLPSPTSSKNIKSNNAFEGLYIGGVVWVRDKNGGMGMALNLIYNREYAEKRLFNYLTGEIGDCIDTFRL
ncbi:hypothetical protein [Chitinophaga silvisoli]|uniref:Uncharacterized protein n=1 Tax=Chitinophaga silvisoli TaxID=2291814 RepID=A0A3E1P4V3_9BACT|nr:hypothetical protein [Chitinophaga silvisoli]RFM35150.1 hypothetical protein DXN04_07085 [Chitinophaga silvisoli]